MKELIERIRELEVTSDCKLYKKGVSDALFEIYKHLDFFRNQFKDHFISQSYMRDTREVHWDFKNVCDINFLEFRSNYINHIKIKTCFNSSGSRTCLYYYTDIETAQLIKRELINFIKIKRDIQPLNLNYYE